MSPVSKLTLYKLLFIVMMAAVSIHSHASIIKQDVSIQITRADIGNLYGVSLADSGYFGKAQYDSGLVFGDIVDTFSDPNFVFEFSLKSLQLSYLQDLFFSIGGPFGFTRAGLPEAGLIGLSFEFINPEGSGFIDLNYFSFTDVNALQIEGIISFSQPLTVDEPITVWLLLCVVLITLIRRLQRESLFVSVLSSNTKEQTKKRN